MKVVSTLYIHIPGTPTLLVVVRFLISSVPDPGREKIMPEFAEENEADAAELTVSLIHCMSSYRKVTNESSPSVAITTW